MNIERLQLMTDGGWEEMNYENNCWVYNDVRVSADDDGKIEIYAKESGISQMRVLCENPETGDVLLLSDAWERAYGDLGWKKPDINIKMPWYFMMYCGETVRGFGVKTQPNAMCSWQYSQKNVILNIDLRSGTYPVELNGRALYACTVVMHKFDGDLFGACRDFCSMLCDSPRYVKRPVFGGNDWYCCYGDNSEEKILKHARYVAECARNCSCKPYMVVDDGWQICHHNDAEEYYNGGPWKYSNINFPDMKTLADKMDKIGVIPGIWFRPLLTVEKFPNHYYLKHKRMDYILDPSVPEVLEKIKDDVRTIKNWGYRLIKHDFSTYDIFRQWGFEMNGDIFANECSFFDRTKTTAQIIKNFYAAIREAAGEDIILMGCNTMSHLSAGIFDIQRTGDDTSGKEWERTKKYGINTLAFRMPQHNTFYTVDADCVGITKHIAWETNKQWLELLSKSGTPLFVSIAEDMYNDRVKSDIKAAFERVCMTSEVSRPLDWMNKKTPEIWESRFGTDVYKWDA